MNIFVACSSSSNINDKYKDRCRILLEQLFKGNNDLVFGADEKGLMGLAYEIALKYNRKIIGVATPNYKDCFSNLNCTKEISVDSVIDRTKALVENADVIIVLPGGIGTIVELFIILEMKRNKEISKPIFIFNIDNFFDDILNMLQKIYNEKLAEAEFSKEYIVTDNIDKILKTIDKY